jgi:beta-lactam-binding protein with PASTA domain
MQWAIWLGASFLALIVAFGVGYVYAVRIMFPELDVGRGGVPVPKVAGLDFADARRQLEEVGLIMGDTASLPHLIQAAGIVLAQDPLPGQQLRAGAGVRVAVSSGLPRSLLPDVRGLLFERAGPLLTSLGFQVMQRGEPSEMQAGRVLRMEPEPGRDYDLPTQVALVVSNGLPQPDSLAVPPDSAPAETPPPVSPPSPQ